jgi:hypothetical protein
MSKKLTIEQMQELAKSRGGLCLSKKYVGKDARLKWKCKKGHEWETSYGNIRSGTWCPHCARKFKLTIEEMIDWAKIKGGKCLSEEYTNSKTKLRWQCKEGHEWATIPNIIQQGRWCPLCSQRVSERICRGFFETIFQKKFPTLKPTWLINSRGNRMELDGYSKDLGLAFEYHGIQHYQTRPIFIKEKDELEQRKKDDKLKIQLCKKNNVVLIEVPYTVSYEEMDDYIIKKCKERKVSVPEITKKIDYKLLDVFSPQRLREMKDLAKLRGGLCLSKRYINRSTKLKWKCAEGHIWEATPHSVKNKPSWCHYCGGSAKLTIEQMQEIAKSRGGKCLSKTYVNSQTKLKWKCKEGHEWNSIPASINQGHWCQKCWYQRTREEDLT